MLPLLLSLALADPSFVVQRDVPYRPEGAQVGLDVYRVDGRTDAPVVVFVHGGGWRGGDKKSAAPVARAFVPRGFAVVSVQYRLIGEVDGITPLDQADDVAAALRWVLDHREELGVGEDLVLMGWSAGAHLVSLVAVDGPLRERHGLGPEAIDAVIALDIGAYDVPRAIDEACALGWCTGEASYRLAFPEEEDRRKGSPLLRVPSLGRPPPPFLVVSTPTWGSATQTLSKVQSERFVAALKAAGGQATHAHLAGEGHTTLLPDLGKKGDALTAAVGEFLGALPDSGDKSEPEGSKKPENGGTPTRTGEP